MKNFVKRTKRFMIIALVFVFAFSLVSPAFAAGAVGMSVSATPTQYQNLYWGNMLAGSNGKFLTLTNVTDKFTIDASGNVKAAGYVSSTDLIINSAGVAAGKVWTSSGTTGAGSWQTPAGSGLPAAVGTGNFLQTNANTWVQQLIPAISSTYFTSLSGANLTNLPAGQLSGTIPAGILGNSSVFIGTTAVPLNRASGALPLTGITSIDGSAATAGTVTTAAQPNITSAANLATVGTIGTGIWHGTVIATTYGGTGNANGTANVANGSNGAVVYQTAANTTGVTAVGSSGQVLQSNGAGAPTWVNPSSGMGGSGTANTVAKFTAGTTLGNSIITDNGSSVAVAGNCGSAACRNFQVTYPGGGSLTNAELSGLTYPSGDGYSMWTALYAKQGSGNLAGLFNGTTAVMGSLGVGTTGPGYKLDVSGNIRTTGTIFANANGASYLCGGDDACLNDVNLANTVGIYGTESASAEGGLALGNSGAVLYGKGGNVGIGTIVPGSKLHVYGGYITDEQTAGVQTYLGSTASAGYLQTSGTWPLTFYAGGTQAMTILNSGNVGIGVSSPQAKLELMGPTAPNSTSLASQVYIGKFLYTEAGGNQYGLTMKSIRDYVSGDWSYAGVRLAATVASDGYSIDNYYNNMSWIDFYGVGYSNALRFGTNNVERMRIDQSGNVGIGVTPSGTYRLQVTGAAPNQSGLSVSSGASGGSGIVASGYSIGVQGSASQTGVYGTGGTIGVQGLGTGGASYGVEGGGGYAFYASGGTQYDFYGADAVPNYFAGMVSVGDFSHGMHSSAELYAKGGSIGLDGDGTSYGVVGSAISGTGVYGSGSGTGVYGSGGSYGVYGMGGAIGVQGFGTGGASFGVEGGGGYAFYASGGTQYDFYGADAVPNYFAGNVGIGTTNPTNGKLDVEASGVSVYGYSSGNSGVWGNSSGSSGVYGSCTASGCIGTYGTGWANGYGVYGFNGASGGIGVGASGSSYDFYGASGNPSHFAGSLTIGTSAVAGQAGDLGVSRNASPNTGVINFGSSGFSYLYYDGTNYNLVGATSLIVNGTHYTSDIRFKKDITPLQDSLSKVLALQGVNYKWNTQAFPDRDFSTSSQIGFIAQEVQKIIPEVVSTGVDGYESVDYGKITPVLVEAIKEQQAQIETLKTNNQNLQTQVDSLNSRLGEIEKKLGIAK